MLISYTPYDYFNPPFPNKATKYLCYVSGYNLNTLKLYGFISCYFNKDKDFDTSPHLGFLFKDIHPKLLDNLKHLHLIECTDYEVNGNNYLFVEINLSRENLYREEIGAIIAVRKGKYSEIPKAYVKKWSQPSTSATCKVGDARNRYSVMYNDDRYRKNLADYFGVDPKNLIELDTLPRDNEEYFLYTISGDENSGLTEYDKEVELILEKANKASFAFEKIVLSFPTRFDKYPSDPVIESGIEIIKET